MKLPSMQWYPGDWLRDPGVQALSYEDQGIWFAILMRMWEGEERGKLTLNGAAMPVEALARLLGLDNQKTTTTLTTLLTYGVTSVEPSTGIIFSRRMVRDEELRKKRAECGKLGGNPLLLNQTSNQKTTTGVKQISTPSSSSSSSSSEECIVPTSGTATPRKRFTPPTPDEVLTYGQEIGFDIDAEKFCDFYASKGWKVGNAPMKDWKAAVRTWRAGQHSTPAPRKNVNEFEEKPPMWTPPPPREPEEPLDMSQFKLEPLR